MKKCDRCKILFDALIEEYEEKGIVEQYTICPRCKHKNSIIFYDEYLEWLDKYYE
jgi:phage FluMu protein Com